MKKFTSLFVVVLLLAAFSLSTFAAGDIYASTTIEDGKIGDVFAATSAMQWDPKTVDGVLDFDKEAATTYYTTPDELKGKVPAAYTWKMDLYLYGTETQDGNGSVNGNTNKFKYYDSSFMFRFGGEKNCCFYAKYNFKLKQYELIYQPRDKKKVLDPEDQWMLEEKDPEVLEQKLITLPEELTMNEWHEVVLQISKNGEVRLYVDDQIKLKYVDNILQGEIKSKKTGEVIQTFPLTVDPKCDNANKIFTKYNLQLKMDNIMLADSEYYDFHTFDESRTTVVDAKEFKDGAITKYCKNCNEACVTVLPALGCAGHIGGTATCTSKAVCSKCGVKYGQMADHAWGSDVVVESQATSLKEGRSYVTCSVCGAKKYTVTILDPNNPDPSDPIYKDGYVVPAPGDNDGQNNGDNNADQNGSDKNEPDTNKQPNGGGNKKDDNKANPGTSDLDVFGLAALVSVAGLTLVIKKRV